MGLYIMNIDSLYLIYHVFQNTHQVSTNNQSIIIQENNTNKQDNYLYKKPNVIFKQKNIDLTETIQHTIENIGIN